MGAEYERTLVGAATLLVVRWILDRMQQRRIFIRI
jgi:hypothetical protein